MSPEALKVLANHHYRGNVRELKNILMRAMLFSKGPRLTREDILHAASGSLAETIGNEKTSGESVHEILEQLEAGKGDFWSKIYQPFKANRMTRDTLKTIIDAAKSRYQTNLPGAAVKLGVCRDNFRDDAEENKKFISFKNFIYKTIKITR